MVRTRSGRSYGGVRRRNYYGLAGAATAAYGAGMYLYRRATGGYRRATQGTSGVGVTSQYDKTNVYTRKRMPWKKRKRWVKFVKRVRAANFKDIGTKTVVFNNALSSIYSGEGQRMLCAAVYGADGAAPGSSYCGMNDLKNLFNNDPDLNTSFTSKAIFGSAILDLTLTNQSAAENGNNAGIEVDIYDIVFTKKSDANSLNAMVTEAQLETPTITGINGLDLAFRGVTFFDFPMLGSKGLKILRKKKYFLAPGQVATYQLRDPKNRTITNGAIQDSDDNFMIPGQTRVIAIIFKGVPTQDHAAATKHLQVGVTRKYMYKVLKSNTDADLYV